jgi:hypothetical protein
MRITANMAAILEDELRELGIVELTRPDCEGLVHSMIERMAELEADIKKQQLESHPGGRTSGQS